MARGFLGTKGRSSGTRTPKSSGSTAPETTTPDGGGTPSDKGMFPLTDRVKSSIADSDSGSPMTTFGTDGILRSISEQCRDFRRDGLVPRYTIVHPETLYHLRKDTSALLYSVKYTGAESLMGTDIVVADWVPVGIAIVSDRYDPDTDGFAGLREAMKSPFITTKTEWKLDASRDYYDATAFGDTAKTYFTASPSSFDYSTSSSYWKDFDIPLTATSSGTYTAGIDYSTGSREFKDAIAKAYADIAKKLTREMVAGKDDKIPLTGSITIKEGHPKKPVKSKEQVWADRIVEVQEPDPSSIYGKALARAREEAKK